MLVKAKSSYMLNSNENWEICSYPMPHFLPVSSSQRLEKVLAPFCPFKVQYAHTQEQDQLAVILSFHCMMILLYADAPLCKSPILNLLG